MTSARGIVAGVAALLLAGSADARTPPPLTLERTIPLADVGGRIDHLAIDAAGRRLFVAELGSGAVESIDLASGRSLGRITGLKEPQGLVYVPDSDELAVATGGDGMVRFYRAGDLALLGQLRLGDDADNARLDPRSGHVLVGYGAGALAEIDPARRKLVGSVDLPAHPEAFQIDGDRAFVNVPGVGRVVVIDRKLGRQAQRWPNPRVQLNFPMALVPEAGQVAVVYRLPATLVLFDAADGMPARKGATCGDADDVYADAKRRRLYVVCGAGAVDVFDLGGTSLARIARIETRRGARTGLFAPVLDRLFVAAPARAGEPAAILVYRPLSVGASPAP